MFRFLFVSISALTVTDTKYNYSVELGSLCTFTGTYKLHFS